MDKETRKKRILKSVLKHTTLQTIQLEKIFQVSRETIRRDLSELVELELIERKYGEVRVLNREKIRQHLRSYGLLQKDERQDQIESAIKKRNRIRISSLATEFNVTPATIRKDIEELKERSNILKNHGTVVYDTENPIRKLYSGIPSRIEPEVRMIATRALSLIKPAETIYLDGGLVSQYIARHISIENRSIIVTDSIDVIQILMQRDYGNETILVPGTVDFLVGRIKIRDAEEILERVLIHKAILNLEAFHPEYGFYVSSFCEHENIRVIIEKAENAVVCVLSSTIGNRGTLLYPFNEAENKIIEIITDDHLSNDIDTDFLGGKIPFAVCGEGYTRKTPKTATRKIGLLHAVSNSYYAKTVRESIERAINSHHGLSLVEMETNDEIKNVIRQIDYMLKEKVEVLIVYINNYEIGHLISEKCSSANLKLLSIDTSHPGSVFYGVHNYLAGKTGGRECARYVTRHWSGEVDCIVNIEMQAAGIISGYRLTGMIDELKKSVTIDDPQIHHLDTSMLLKFSVSEIRERILRVIGRHNIFLSFNEKTTIQIHEIISTLPENTHNILIGHNFNDRIRRLMKTPGSPLIGCIAYHPENYGEDILKIINQLIEKKEVAPMNYTSHEWINNEQWQN